MTRPDSLLLEAEVGPRISLISGFLLGALLFAFAPVIARGFYHAPSYEQILQEVAPLIPLMAVMQVFTGGLQAFKEIKWKVCIELGLSVITLIALVIFYLVGWRMEALCFSALISFLCSVLIGQRVFSKIMKRFIASFRCAIISGLRSGSITMETDPDGSFRRPIHPKEKSSSRNTKSLES